MVNFSLSQIRLYAYPRFYAAHFNGVTGKDPMNSYSSTNGLCRNILHKSRVFSYETISAFR